MELPINIGEVDAANRFLRALWAVFRKECGNCAWQYTPCRDGPNNRIMFGFVNIGRPEGSLAVGVTYRQKGSIRTIFFNHADGDRPVNPQSDLGVMISGAVEAAMKLAGLPDQKTYSVLVECLRRPVAYYKGSLFEIIPISKRRLQLSLNLRAYDELDAKTLFLAKMARVLDVLAVETNSAFWPVAAGEAREDEPLESPVERVEAFPEIPDWIDDYPVRQDCYLLSAEGKQMVDWAVADGDGGESASIFLRACSHFHTARKYAAQVADLHEYEESQTPQGMTITVRVRDPRLHLASRLGAAHAEITGTLYMSALEVASLIGAPGPEKCKECGLDRFKITERVTKLMSDCGGGHFKRIAKEFYGQRSQYLHEGVMLASSDYSGVSMPLLDPSSPNLCRVQVSAPSLNLLEYSGYCLRKVLKRVVSVA